MLSVNIDYQKTYENIKNFGIHIIPNAASCFFCESIIKWFNSSFYSMPHESYYDDTEIRIYNSECFNQNIMLFKYFSDRLLSNIFYKDFNSYSILAIRNNALLQNYTHIDNRWHIDSFHQQIKTFLFLNDVNTYNGAFEYFPYSHKFSFKLDMVLHGNYFKLNNFFNGKRAYTSISNSSIGYLNNKSIKPIKVEVKRGTLVIADTSMLHRASPCLKDTRYALTSYYK
jgi:hypothetical protein